LLPLFDENLAEMIWFWKYKIQIWIRWFV
jgi:hypothetical protein